MGTLEQRNDTAKEYLLVRQRNCIAITIDLRKPFAVDLFLGQLAEEFVYGVFYFDCTLHRSTGAYVTAAEASGEREVGNVRLVRACWFPHR